jgi:hypothetical protein
VLSVEQPPAPDESHPGPVLARKTMLLDLDTIGIPPDNVEG